MLNYWSIWIIEDRCREAPGLEQERIECQSTQDMAYACGETLGSEQETIKCQSTYDLTHACGEALRLE